MGTSDGPNATSYGELAIDSLIWNDMQLTNLRGPFWSDSTVCYFGKQSDRPSSASRRAASRPTSSAAASSPTSCSNTPANRATTPIFRSAAIDLGRFARERLGGPNDLTGTCQGTLSLDGAGRSTNCAQRQWRVARGDANIYQLPPLVAMLKVLRNRTPDSTAFDRCDMQFDVRGEHIHFQQLNLLGDAVSLYGRGETNFDRRLDLTFYTLVGPADLPIPLWKTVAGHLSEQGLQIKVDWHLGQSADTPRSVPGREPDARTDSRRSRTGRGSRRTARVGRNPLGHAAAMTSRIHFDRRSTMSVGSLGGIIGSAAGVPLSQTSGSETERTAREGAAQERAVDGAERSEKAAGIGTTEQDQETSERDADGRRLWEVPPEKKKEKPTTQPRQSRDATRPMRHPARSDGLNTDRTGVAPRLSYQKY